MRKLRLLAALLATTAGLYALTGISGNVTDSATGLPVQNARVCCRAESSRAYTDSVGYYRFTDLVPGVYTVTVRTTGYEPDTFPEPVLVLQDSITAGIDFTLRRSGVGGIAGFVLDSASRQPVVGASVYTVGAANSASTDSNGYFEIHNVPVGRYVLRARADWHVQATYPESVSVVAGQVTPDIDFDLVPAGAIAGLVTSAGSGMPLVGASVYAFGPNGSAAAATDTGGHYGIYTQLRPGWYRVRAQATGYVTAYHPDSVEVIAGQLTPAIDFALLMAGAIRGRVTDVQTGLGIAHAAVNGSGLTTAYTDSAGNYTLAANPGSYSLWASRDAYLNGIYPESVSVVQGGTTDSIDFALIPTSGITGLGGRLTDASRMLGIPGGAVVASGPNGTDSATSVRTGGYLIDGLAPGRYQVVARAEGFQTLVYPESAVVTAGQVRWTPFYMQPSGGASGSIAGRVTSADSSTVIVNARVYANGAHGSYRVLQGEQGYEVSAPPGTYWVSAAFDGFELGHYPDSVTVSEGQVTDSVDFVLVRAGSSTGGVSGTVTNARNGGAIFGALVVATGPGQGYANTGTMGAYVVNGLQPGNYLVMAVAAGFQPSNWDTVEVTAGHLVTGVDFALEPSGADFGNIGGAVLDSATQEPVPGARVFAWGAAGQGYGYADSAGGYVIQSVAAGWYRVRAQADGYYPAYFPESVHVAAGQTTGNVDFELRPLDGQACGIAGFAYDGFTQTELAGALVTATGTAGSWSVQSDGHGNYLLDCLPPGDYLVEAEASGYGPGRYPCLVSIADGSLACDVCPALYPASVLTERGAPTGPAMRLQVGPNPTRGISRIRWQIETAGRVSLRLFDNSGRLVRALREGIQAPGSYSTNWDGRADNGRRTPRGVYFCRLETSGHCEVVKVAVLDE
jgi:hypothetical protein